MTVFINKEIINISNIPYSSLKDVECIKNFIDYAILEKNKKQLILQFINIKIDNKYLIRKYFVEYIKTQIFSYRSDVYIPSYLAAFNDPLIFIISGNINISNCLNILIQIYRQYIINENLNTDFMQFVTHINLNDFINHHFYNTEHIFLKLDTYDLNICIKEDLNYAIQNNNVIREIDEKINKLNKTISYESKENNYSYTNIICIMYAIGIITIEELDKYNNNKGITDKLHLDYKQKTINFIEDTIFNYKEIDWRIDELKNEILNELKTNKNSLNNILNSIMYAIGIIPIYKINDDNEKVKNLLISNEYKDKVINFIEEIIENKNNNELNKQIKMLEEQTININKKYKILEIKYKTIEKAINKIEQTNIYRYIIIVILLLILIINIIEFYIKNRNINYTIENEYLLLK